jgi:hypothetical protein
MVEMVSTLEKRIKKIGNNIFATRSKLTHEDPQMLMKRSLDDFQQELQNQGMQPLLLDARQIHNNNPNDFVTDYETKTWDYEYLIPYEINDKPHHIICHVNNTTYVMPERNEYNAYMDCASPSKKNLDLELMDKRTKLTKKGDKWVLGE